jgi:hypothetical protein
MKVKARTSIPIRAPGNFLGTLGVMSVIRRHIISLNGLIIVFSDLSLFLEN